MIQWIKHWAEIAYMAVICLYQEITGQEPDCIPCWKCEMMRVIVLCLGTAVMAYAVKTVWRLL